MPSASIDPREDLLADGAVTVAEAEREFGLGRSVLYELMSQGKLAFCQPNHRRLIPRRAIRRYLAGSMVGATAAE